MSLLSEEHIFVLGQIKYLMTFFFRGRELARRIAERDREKESDNKDRQKEKEEIEEIKNKVMEEDHEDPKAAYEKVDCSSSFLNFGNIRIMLYNV